MPRFTFDVKAFITVHVDAEDEAAARRTIDEALEDLVTGEWAEDGVHAPGRRRLFINSCGLDGEHDLMEIDGEDPDAEPEEPRADGDIVHVGELSGDGGRVIRDQNGLTVYIALDASRAKALVADHNAGRIDLDKMPSRIEGDHSEFKRDE